MRAQSRGTFQIGVCLCVCLAFCLAVFLCVLSSVCFLCSSSCFCLFKFYCVLKRLCVVFVCKVALCFIVRLITYCFVWLFLYL